MSKRLLILLLLTLALLTGAASSKTLSVDEILEKHRQSASALEDLQAAAHLDLEVLLGILPYRESLDGSYFYQKPDRHKLEFKDAPSYLQKAPSMFNWKLPNPDKYKVVAVSPDGKNNDSYQLFYKPNNAGSSTQSIACYFDPDNFRLTRQETSYKDGGSVKLKFAYQKSTELPVLESVKAAVVIPAYKLTGGATITFSGQQANAGLDKSIFEGSTD